MKADLLLLLSARRLLHHVDKELSGVAHGQAQGLAGGGELRGYGGQLPARRGTGGCCGQVWGLWGQTWGPVDQARAVGYV